MHAVDSGSRGEHALPRHLRAAREVEHLVVDAVQVGVEQGPFPGRKLDLMAGIQVGILSAIFINLSFSGKRFSSLLSSRRT